MAIIVKMELSGMDSSKYDAIIRRLGEIGLNAPDGRLYHICYGDRRNLQVVDIFESQEKMDTFADKLMPILKEYGIEVKPDIEEVYNILLR